MPFQHNTDSIISFHYFFSLPDSLSLAETQSQVFAAVKFSRHFAGYMFSIEINFAFIKLLFYNLFPSDRYAFLCKITVLAFLGMQLWSISSLKNLNGEH